MHLIQQFVDRCLAHSPRIGVVGDSMIDSYYQVSVNRISPEFPIPVMLSETNKPSKSVPGGAANVARQLLSINCIQRLISLVDHETEDVLKEYKIDHKDSIYSYGIQVPRKKRFYDGDFPICRLDIEKKNHGVLDETIDKLRDLAIQRYNGVHEKLDMMILSDYGKGFFCGIDSYKWCQLGIPIIVDPKAESCSNWHRCKVFKPNAKDAYLITGETDKREQVKLCREFLDCESVVVTDSGNGVYGWDGDAYDYFEIKNEHKVIPRSVIGAGDAFSAFLAVAIAHGFSVRDASEIAFRAGQVYVGSTHNEPVTLHSLLKSVDQIAAKFLHPPKNGDRLVFVNGCFDCLHVGHLEFLRFAKSKGDRLIVALNTDDSVKRLKGEFRPIRTLKDRIAVVAGLDCVDHVTSFDEDTPAKCIERIMPKVVVMGEEYQGRPITDIGCFYRDIKMEFFPRIDGISTTEEIKRIRS